MIIAWENLSVYNYLYNELLWNVGVISQAVVLVLKAAIKSCEVNLFGIGKQPLLTCAFNQEVELPMEQDGPS